METTDKINIIDNEIDTNQRITYHKNILRFIKIYRWENNFSFKSFLFRYFLMEKCECDLEDLIKSKRDSK